MAAQGSRELLFLSDGYDMGIFPGNMEMGRKYAQVKQMRYERTQAFSTLLEDNNRDMVWTS